MPNTIKPSETFGIKGYAPRPTRPTRVMQPCWQEVQEIF